MCFDRGWKEVMEAGFGAVGVFALGADAGQRVGAGTAEVCEVGVVFVAGEPGSHY